MKKWRIDDSRDLYNVKGWGVNYFDINEKGHAEVVISREINLRQIEICLSCTMIPSTIGIQKLTVDAVSNCISQL